MIDHPYDKATSEFIVTAPSKYQVVANGLLQETIDLGDGRRLTHWKQSVPIASWLNAIGVEQFAVHHAGTVKGIELTTWVAHQDDRGRPHLLRGAGARGARVLQRAHRPVPVREARERRGGGTRRRHRARQLDLLRRERHSSGRDGVSPGHRPRLPRDRAPVVRRLRHRKRLGRRLAERGVRDVLHAALHRALGGARGVRRRPSVEPPADLHARAPEPRHEGDRTTTSRTWAAC